LFIAKVFWLQLMKWWNAAMSLGDLHVKKQTKLVEIICTWSYYWVFPFGPQSNDLHIAALNHPTLCSKVKVMRRSPLFWLNHCTCFWNQCCRCFQKPEAASAVHSSAGPVTHGDQSNAATVSHEPQFKICYDKAHSPMKQFVG
jgi:hypothetical protein